NPPPPPPPPPLFKQTTEYEILRCLVGSEMCIRDRLPGASEMNFEGGVSQSAYETLAALNLPKPQQGPETINQVTEHKMSAE
ncbi:hypothetical protein ACX3V1_02805, partial [Escherichia coli]